MNDAHVAWIPNLICSGQNWDQLPGLSRVWIYLADRMLSDQEQVELGDELEAFVQQWSAHGTLLQASWQLLGGRALAIGLDEGHANASGCSIDASVACLRAFSKQTSPDLDWFRRDQVLHQNARNEWVESSLHAFWAGRKAGVVGDKTLLINLMCFVKHEWETRSMVEFDQSWHQEMW